MTLDETVAALAAADVLPRAAMRWALDSWDEAGPRFIRMLDDYASGADRSDETANVLFFALHLIGERGDANAFPAICSLLRDTGACETVLGDAITETLRGIVIATFDGNSARLAAIAEDAAADDFVREACILAMAYLTRTGRVSEDEMRDALLRLTADLDAETDEVIFSGCAMAVAHLGFADLAPRIEALFRPSSGLIPILDVTDFREALAETLADPEGMAGFEKDHVGPLTDAIGVLAGWYGFSEAAAKERASSREDIDEPLLNEPYVNPFRHVGRNDPCPCGSGKKYKKCCLA